MLADGLGTFFSSVHAEDRKPVRLPLAVWPTCLIRFSASKLRLPSAFSPRPCEPLTSVLHGPKHCRYSAEVMMALTTRPATYVLSELIEQNSLTLSPVRHIVTPVSKPLRTDATDRSLAACIAKRTLGTD